MRFFPVFFDNSRAKNAEKRSGKKERFVFFRRIMKRARFSEKRKCARGRSMKLSELFDRCLNIRYTHVANSADYATERKKETLYIYFECSDGITDWVNNFDFPAKPYKRMGRTVWFAHRGFLKVWKSIEGHVRKDLLDRSVKKIVIVGYSHGAAVAALCHEYVWFNRPDLRHILEGYGFGCPRVFWGIRSEKTNGRWENFTVIRNINDIVTHLPPVLFGFSHVGKLLKIGTRKKYSCVDAHRPENIATELRIYEWNLQRGDRGKNLKKCELTRQAAREKAGE